MKKKTNYQKYIELLNSPPDDWGKKRELWRQEVKNLRKKSDEDHRNWVKSIQQQWGEGEWETVESELEKLSTEQLRAITTNVGIVFTGGNERINDRQEFIMVLDEAKKEDLYRELKKIKGN